MTIKSHHASLMAQYRKLENEFAAALADMSTDELKLLELKRRMLQLREEILCLREHFSA